MKPARYKPPGVAIDDVDFLYVGLDKSGAIVRTVAFRAPANQGDAAGRARKEVFVDARFQVYRIRRDAGDALSFERV